MNTHFHWDHTQGGQNYPAAWPAGLEIISSEKTRGNIEQRGILPRQFVPAAALVAFALPSGGRLRYWKVERASPRPRQAVPPEHRPTSTMKAAIRRLCSGLSIFCVHRLQHAVPQQRVREHLLQLRVLPLQLLHPFDLVDVELSE